MPQEFDDYSFLYRMIVERGDVTRIGEWMKNSREADPHDAVWRLLLTLDGLASTGRVPADLAATPLVERISEEESSTQLEEEENKDNERAVVEPAAFAPFQQLVARDWCAEYWVFRQRSVKGPPTLLPEYQGLACSKCDRLDLIAALEQGVSPELAAPRTDRDLIITMNEGALLFNKRARRAFESIGGVEAKFYPLPKAPDWFVAMPARLIYPPNDMRYYNPVEPAARGEAFQARSRPCKKCDRLRSVTWRSEWYFPPNDVVLAGVVLEHRPIPHICWIASQRVIDALKQQHLAGWHRLGCHPLGIG